MSAIIVFRFRLYVAGDAQNSIMAIANATELCRSYLPNRHQLEVVDVLRDPQRALVDGVFMTPTLVKLAPAPIRRIVGTLSHARPVLEVFGMDTVAT